jgi:tripartite ATP-independent transporter DctM subunit
VSWVAKWELIIPIVLVGGLITGLFRFHEASAFTAVYVLLIEVFVYKDIGIRKDLPRIVIESMTMLGAVLIILATAVGFTGWMIQAELPNMIFDFMDDHIHTRVGFLLALNVFLVLIGMFTDGVTAILIVVPLILPLGYAYDVDPYHMAAIFLLNLEMGFLIPPVGMNLFISSIRFGKTVAYVCRSVIPTLLVLTVTLGIVTYVPALSTWLPGLIEVKDDDIISIGGGRVIFKEDKDKQALDAVDPMDEDLAPMDEDEMEAAFAEDGAVDGGADGGDAGVAP